MFSYNLKENYLVIEINKNLCKDYIAFKNYFHDDFHLPLMIVSKPLVGFIGPIFVFNWMNKWVMINHCTCYDKRRPHATEYTSQQDNFPNPWIHW